MVLVVDSHVHLYEFSDKEIESIMENDKELVIVAVSDDVESALRTYEIAELYKGRVVPCVGFHPWNLREGRGLQEAWEAARAAYRLGVTCIGEVGVDRKFVDKSLLSLQIDIFKLMVRMAAELGAGLNIHSPDAWSIVLGILAEEGYGKAILHWYTGPVTLLESMRSLGVKASINAAIRIQKKSIEVAKNAPLDIVVFESDGPYEYKGLRLNPLMTRETIRIVANMRGVNFDTLSEEAARRSLSVFGIR